MIKVSDYIVKKLVEAGVQHIFMISGGGAMHLNDSVGKCRQVKYICNHHEQASSMAAEGYARSSGKMGVVVVTSGPGGTNTLTGVTAQWLDSIPVLYISGQVKFETTISSCPDIGLRQLGDQEINIVDIVKPITRYAKMVTDPLEIKKVLEKAIYLAVHGRPGPVWIDVPLNIQSAVIDEEKLTGYDEKEDAIKPADGENLSSKITKVIDLLKNSKRPVFLAGHGIRIAKAQDIFLNLTERLKIPVLSTFNGYDLIPTGNPLYIGRVGTVGTRAGNFALQNSDLLISLGSRNNIRQVSYNWKVFARAAKKVIVDIDEKELKKPTIEPDIGINADAKDFLEELQKQIKGEALPDFKDWVKWCGERKNRYPVVLPEYRNSKSINPYHFIEVLTKNLKEGSIIVSANGTACVSLFQAGIVKKNQRCFWNSGCASMGYDLPAAIGASLANKKKEVVCLAGDGSLMMNIQELATIVHYGLPVKIFVLDNEGYISMKQTQENFFENRYVACDNKCGVGFPDFIKVAKGFGLTTEIIKSRKDMEQKIKGILGKKYPVVCEVKLLTDYKFSPKLSSELKPDGTLVSKPLEDMYPFLDRKEFSGNMIIPEWKP